MSRPEVGLKLGKALARKGPPSPVAEKKARRLAARTKQPEGLNGTMQLKKGKERVHSLAEVISGSKNWMQLQQMGTGELGYT